VHRDGDDGSIQGDPVVLGVFPAQQVVSGGHLLAAVVHRGGPVDPHPPKLIPIVFVMVDEQAHPRIHFDIGQPAKTLRRFPLGVYRGVHHVMVQGENHRNQMRQPFGRHRCKRGDRRVREPAHRVEFSHKHKGRSDAVAVGPIEPPTASQINTPGQSPLVARHVEVRA
jgi:hypothetical protein